MSELAELPLVELRIDSPRGESTELRVRADGRFEIRAAGQDEWAPAGEYSEEDLAELRRAMAAADDPPLPSVIEETGGTDRTRMTWRLRLADEVREIVVEEWHDGVSPPLERLYRSLFTIPSGPAVESIWRVRLDGATVERRVVGEAAGVPALAPMLGALYRRPDPFEAAGAGAGAAPADPLVEVRHFVDGAPGDAFAIAPDGRVFLTEGGETTEVTRLDPEQLAALREAIAETGWPRLPDPLVGTAPDGADPSRAIR